MPINKIIRRYEALRSKLQILEERCDRVDAELVELEELLPESYHYPGDSELEDIAA